MSRSLDERLLDLLACPCPQHAGVSPTPDGRALVCDRCASAFPIRDGIPVMLLDEATPGPDGFGAGG